MADRPRDRIYKIERDSGGRLWCAAFSPAGKHLVTHRVRHSPDGFETGYGGSGPADLALSILTDFLGSLEDADPLYQQFKRAFIANRPLSPGESYQITGAEIDQWIQALR